MKRDDLTVTHQMMNLEVQIRETRSHPADHRFQMGDEIRPRRLLVIDSIGAACSSITVKSPELNPRSINSRTSDLFVIGGIV